MIEIIHLLKLGLSEPQYSSFDECENACLAANKSDSITATMELSLRATSIGQAFAIGYRCALQALLPELKQDQWAAFCATELKGNHPKQIETHVNGEGIIHGHKTFVSMGTKAQQLIVLAKAGEQDARPVLKAVLVNAAQDEMRISDMPDLGMIPDIPHGQLMISGARGEVLSGDGYLKYSKRFRTLEDVHVLASFVSFIISMVVRYKLSDGLLTRGVYLLQGCADHSLQDSASQHLVLDEGFKLFDEWVVEFEKSLSELPDSFSDAWERDRKLFHIAGKARQKRAQNALNDMKTLLQAKA